MSERQWQVPAARYTDPAFLLREQNQVFGRAWIAVCQANRLKATGDFVAVDGVGPGVFVIRDSGGVLRAFRNSCRHRGTRLVEGQGNLKAIRCPYHDWKYSLDGRLRHIPRAEGFRPLERDGLGLIEVRLERFAGFVWVTLDDDAPPLRDTLVGLDDELEAYGLDDMEPIEEKVWTLPCNWKAVLDNATESYHLPVVHGLSVDQAVDSQAEFKTYGDHYRLTLDIGAYGWRRKLDDRTARGGPYSDHQMSALHKYVIFPNFLMNVLPYHLTVFQVFPDGPDRCRFFYGFYQRRGARGLEWLRAHVTWFASRMILEEDLRILERFQAGVKAGAQVDHRFHEDEVAIAHFHRVLTDWLAR
ncbi:MAG: phenylpropionate dioxygenase-like ring-hydroxylating dioxygenase large terminal subunit [Myxococcota bacterium]|jgi:phenylpropionate dioxygenase-like ring-hydroxylating dioxygenase large terminal subunit